MENIKNYIPPTAKTLKTLTQEGYRTADKSYSARKKVINFHQSEIEKLGYVRVNLPLPPHSYIVNPWTVNGWKIDTRELTYKPYHFISSDKADFCTIGQLQEYTETIKHRFVYKKFGV